MLNLSMVIVSDVVSLRERGKWQGILSAGAATGSAAGPFIGALLAENVGWKWVFWIMAPCAVACAILVAFIPLKPVHGSAKDKLKKIDYYGAFLSLAATIFVLIPISAGGTTYAWNSPTVVAMLVVGGVLWVSFILVEWKVARLPVFPRSSLCDQTHILIKLRAIQFQSASGHIVHQHSSWLVLFSLALRVSKWTAHSL